MGIGIYIDKCSVGAVVYTHFDKIVSVDGFSGVKGLGFCQEVSDVLTVVIPAAAVRETMTSNDQLLRRIVMKLLDKKNTVSQHCVFVVNAVSSGAAGIDTKQCTAEVERRLTSLLEDTAKTLDPGTFPDPSLFSALYSTTVVSDDKNEVPGILADILARSEAPGEELVARVQTFPDVFRALPDRPQMAMSSVSNCS